MRVSDYRKLLADYNTQRVKTGGERVREQMARSKPKDHQQIIAERLEIGRNIVGNLITTDGSIKRSQIGPNLQEFLNAVIKLANGAKADWPISSRSMKVKPSARCCRSSTTRASAASPYSAKPSMIHAA